eukprot:359416-Chlamydomonas_euryale.AAC.19
MGRTELHGRHGGDWGCMELMGYMGLNGAAWTAWGCMGCMGCMSCKGLQVSVNWQLPPPPLPTQAASPDQAALPRPPPLPAGPTHPPATSKGWCPYDGLGKPSLHMCASASCPKRSTREPSYVVALTCCA